MLLVSMVFVVNSLVTEGWLALEQKRFRHSPRQCFAGLPFLIPDGIYLYDGIDELSGRRRGLM
jgi:hypothetical protein